ncbi:hypothetical protein ABZ901_17655 [Actinacidiphila alni]|uniref:hypothetical protein n=1 Tax=Actinacidiphila alni TaxID=380248 RepID=UPI003409E314
MRRSTWKAAALAIVTAAVAALGTSGAHAADGTVHGCPSGAVCIYPEGASILTSTPTDFFYSYGAHNLHNQFGVHDVFNNQYGSLNATAQLCTGYNGVNCVTTIGLHGNGMFDLTPINSIVLNRP